MLLRPCPEHEQPRGGKCVQGMRRKYDGSHYRQTIFPVLLPGRPGRAALLVCARHHLKTGTKVRLFSPPVKIAILRKHTQTRALRIAEARLIG